MYCQYCGKQLPDGATICMGCGCAVNRPANDSSTAVRLRRDGEEGVSPKNGIATLILFLFLGGFGGHRFFVGRIGSAFGMIALFWIGYVLLILGLAWTGGDVKGSVMVGENYRYPLSEAVGMGIVCILTGGLMLLAWAIIYLIDLIHIIRSRFRDSKGLVIKL